LPAEFGRRERNGKWAAKKANFILGITGGEPTVKIDTGEKKEVCVGKEKTPSGKESWTGVG